MSDEGKKMVSLLLWIVIQELNLIITKGRYCLQEMTDTTVIYHPFDEVICK